MAFKKRYYKIILITLILLTGVASAWAIDDGFTDAKKLEGKYTVIDYLPEINTADLVQSLNMRSSDKVLTGAPLIRKSSDESELAVFLDSLFIQVSDVLDMHLYSLKINIKVCRSMDELKDIYKKMFMVELGNQKSFYVYDSGTIYVSGDSFKREIIGHEMAHAIISHYFVIPAPIKIQEVLAMYVEYNLRRAEQ